MDNLKQQRKKIIEGLELAYKKMILFKKENNTPVIISVDGKVVAVDAKNAHLSANYKWK